MQDTGTRPKLVVSGGGHGVVGHAGARLLADLAEAAGLIRGFDDTLAGLRQRRPVHEPGRVAVDMAVMLADGGETIADLGVLRDQPALFGQVASDATAWRVLDDLDTAALARLRHARAVEREVAWAQACETRGRLPAATAAGREVPGWSWIWTPLWSSATRKRNSRRGRGRMTFGYHPLLRFLDNTGEALSGLLREGRAGSNTTSDHITVLDQAVAQIPDAHRHGTPVLIRTDGAGSTHGFLAHIRSLREHGVDARFSVGAAITAPVRAAIEQAESWVPALDADGDLRDGAEICELTGLLDTHGFPPGTRLIARRERPHPGAQLSLFDTINGMRHQLLATDTPPGEGSLQFLEARHRAHARVEDRIRTGKATGFGRFPSRVFAINQAWLQLALSGIDLLAWTQTLLLDGDLAQAEPKKLRYRLLHVAARIARTARRTWLRIADGWPWATQLITAFNRLAALPRPLTSPITQPQQQIWRDPATRRATTMPTRSNTATSDHRHQDQSLVKDRG